MTEGTSSGLMIVLAIIIFGIFVSMSYLIFGGTLSPSIHNLFEDGASVDLDRESSDAYSTWLWEAEQLEGDQDIIISNLVEKNVKAVYLQYNPFVDSSLYRSFVGKASDNNIEVRALEGDPHWASTQTDESERIILQENFVAWVTDYQNSASPRERFSALHIDLEPHATPTWDSDREGTLENFQIAMENMSNAAQDLNLPLAIDIPFWFTEISYNNTRYGSGNLFDWLVAMPIDEYALMAYRDTAQGPNSINTLVAEEFIRVAGTNKKIAISVETQNMGASEDFLTFYEEGEAYMFEELDKVREFYGDNPNFGGINIHYYDSWINMRD